MTLPKTPSGLKDAVAQLPSCLPGAVGEEHRQAQDENPSYEAPDEMLPVGVCDLAAYGGQTLSALVERKAVDPIRARIPDLSAQKPQRKDGPRPRRVIVTLKGV